MLLLVIEKSIAVAISLLKQQRRSSPATKELLRDSSHTKSEPSSKQEATIEA